MRDVKDGEQMEMFEKLFEFDSIDEIMKEALKVGISQLEPCDVNNEKHFIIDVFLTNICQILLEDYTIFAVISTRKNKYVVSSINFSYSVCYCCRENVVINDINSNFTKLEIWKVK